MEPSQEMLNAASDAVYHGDGAEIIWQAMLRKAMEE